MRVVAYFVFLNGFFMSSCFSNVIADAAKNAVSNAATNLNQRLYERAQRVIPGGVNSPVRAFRAVGGTPRFVQRAQGRIFGMPMAAAILITLVLGGR